MFSLASDSSEIIMHDFIQIARRFLGRFLCTFSLFVLRVGKCWFGVHFYNVQRSARSFNEIFILECSLPSWRFPANMRTANSTRQNAWPLVYQWNSIENNSVRLQYLSLSISSNYLIVLAASWAREFLFRHSIRWFLFVYNWVHAASAVNSHICSTIKASHHNILAVRYFWPHCYPAKCMTRNHRSLIYYLHKTAARFSCPKLPWPTFIHRLFVFK